MDSKTHHNSGTPAHPNQQHHHHQPSSSELISSAKIVAEAAQHTFRHESDKVDKGRVADAAADLLGAASHYGKLEEKGFGKYLDKAENYLHQYHSSPSTHTTTATPHTAAGASTHAPSHSGGESGGHGHSGGGYGDYLKMAEGFLKKH
ncbi:hypothetical protein NMG60_11009299 [Bertholletia excelsa]